MKRSLEDLLNHTEALLDSANEGTAAQRSWKQRQAQAFATLAYAVAMSSVVEYDDKVRKDS